MVSIVRRPGPPSGEAETPRGPAVASSLVLDRPTLDLLGDRFVRSGHELYLVGGPVRDWLMGRASNDLDFTTGALPDETLAIVKPLGATWTVGARFGTIGVQVGDDRCEITTYRADSYGDGSRKPDVAFGKSLEDDLSRRDFTVNAMAIPVPLDVDGPLVDPFGGRDDLAARVLRTPGDPAVSFGDDPLRMLRAVRFVGQLGFSIDPATLDAITEMGSTLRKVSAERIRDELIKLICSADPRPALELLVDSGLAAVPEVLPELVAIKETVDEHRRHKDVWDHTLTVLDQAIGFETDGPDLTLRLAALLHDIGKPATKAVDPDGKVSFHHHEVRGARMTTKRLKALRFPQLIVADVTRLVELHLRFHGYSGGTWTDSAVRRYVRDAGPLLDRLHALTRSDCTTRNRRRAAALAAAYDSLVDRIGELAKAEDLDAMRPDLDGNQIMELLELPPGPAVGAAYRHMLELRIERGSLPPDEAIAELRRWAIQAGFGDPEEPLE